MTKLLQTGKILEEFDRVMFKSLVRKITVLSNKEIEIEFECGIIVRETLQANDRLRSQECGRSIFIEEIHKTNNKRMRADHSLSCKNPFCAIVSGLRFSKAREEQITTEMSEETYNKNK